VDPVSPTASPVEAANTTPVFFLAAAIIHLTGGLPRRAPSSVSVFLPADPEGYTRKGEGREKPGPKTFHHLHLPPPPAIYLVPFIKYDLSYIIINQGSVDCQGTGTWSCPPVSVRPSSPRGEKLVEASR